ncbi:MAG: CsgG/HfaB family protein [Treponema sp.]|nr:CsgG/HfaB family protein [Treponema sp.]
MKNEKISLFVLGSILFSFVSCVSLQDKPLPVNEKSKIIGNVKTEFVSFQILHIQNKNAIKAKAYTKLLEQAKSQYGDNVDVKNIKITGGFSGFEILNIAVALGIGIPLGFVIGDGIYEAGGRAYSIETIGGGALAGTAIGIGSTGNTQKISATGDVVLLQQTGIEAALARAADNTLKNVPTRSRIAIVYITAQDKSTTEYIAGELEFIWVNAGYTIIDRSQLDRIRREQNFQLSGAVDDDTAVSIGKIIGASIIVTGSVDGQGNLRRLRLRALDTQTSQVVGVASEQL